MPSTDFSREVLKNTVFRFSTETQALRSEAMNTIVENALYQVDDWIEEGELTRLLAGTGGVTPSPQQVIDTLDSLERTGRVNTKSDRGDKLYRLRDEVYQEVQNENESSQELVAEVLHDLLEYKDSEVESYIEPFKEVLAFTFAEIGSESVSLLNEGGQTTVIQKDNILEYCNAYSEDTQVDKKVLKGIIIDFFESSEPHFNQLKWRYAQNFFIAKSIGVDYGGPAIGSEAFENAVFYIDTNVAIPAVEPADDLHSSFQLIRRMTSHLNTEFEVSTRTLDELDDWADDQYGKVEDALQSVSENIFSEASSVFSRIHSRMVEDGSYEGPISLFENINKARDILERKDIFLCRNGWFVEDRQDDDITEEVVENVREASLDIRNTDKNPYYQARHDAILLRWIVYKRKEGYNAWILTADTSLPSVEVPGYEGNSLAITLDALLQWLSPAIQTDEDLEAFQEVFAEVIRNRILPQGRIFDLDDLNIFAELDMNVQELPDSDVKKCLEIIKSEAPKLDLGQAEDREKLNHQLRKFLSRPEAEYKEDLKRKEIEIREKEEHINEMRNQLEKKNQKVEGLRDTVSELRGELEDVQKKIRNRTTRSEAKWRIITLAIFIIAETSLPFVLSYQFGGDKALETGNIVSYVPVPALLVVITTFVYSKLISSDHLRAIGLRPPSTSSN